LQQTKEKGTTYPLPRLNELLQQAEFSAIRRWLAEKGSDVGELQGRISEGLDSKNLSLGVQTFRFGSEIIQI